MKRKSTSKTTRSRRDVPYDPNDAKSVREFWREPILHTGLAEFRRKRGQRGPQKAPTKKLVSLRLSREVLSYFKAKGAGWQTRIDETLKSVIARK